MRDGDPLKPLEIGLEPTLQEHIAALVEVFAEVKRVMRDDGTLWCNYGDAYNSQGGHTCQGANSQRQGRSNVTAQHAVKGTNVPGLKPKNLLGPPWRLAFALQEDGWILRSDIIWAKANPMPESVTDRPTRSHEYLFMFSKQPSYFYDAQAIREPAAPDSLRLSKQRPRGEQKNAAVWNVEDHHRTAAERVLTNPAGRNKRSVWTLPSEPTPEAHFATMPQALVEPCILAGTSEWGCCPACGSPWRRVVERSKGASLRSPRGKALTSPRQDGNSWNENNGRGFVPTRIEPKGWEPTCSCGNLKCLSWQGQLVVVPLTPEPCVCLDPFSGSGTVGLVATRLGRRSVLCELNPEYIDISARRNAQLGLGL